MSVNVWLLLIGYPAMLAFVIIYGVFQPWYRSAMGCALMASSTALSALLGINLAYRLWEVAWLARGGWLRAAVYGFIDAGAWLMLGALIYTLAQVRKRKIDP